MDSNHVPPALSSPERCSSELGGLSIPASVIGPEREGQKAAGRIELPMLNLRVECLDHLATPPKRLGLLMENCMGCVVGEASLTTTCGVINLWDNRLYGSFKCPYCV